MRHTRTAIIFLIILVTAMSLSSTYTSEFEDKVKIYGFDIKENKVLITDKGGSIKINLYIEADGADIPEIELASNAPRVADVTIGAIKFSDKNKENNNSNGHLDEDIQTISQSAVITANSWGECDITATLGGISDSVKVIAANKRVALTFDDGTCENTFALLKGLRKENVKATFFIVGSMTKKSNHIDALKTAIKDGHEIGNHTYSHNAAASTLKKELSKTDKIVKKAGGSKTTIMRPPGGAINGGTKKCGKAIIMWSYDTMDWKYRDAKTVKNKLIKHTGNNDIVLLHDLHKTSVKGALSAIKPMKEKGFMFVTVSELLGNPKPNKVYTKGKGKLKTQVLE